MRIAPDLVDYPLIWRPILADPPIYSLAEFQRMTVEEVLIANQILDLRNEMHARALAEAEREARNNQQAGR
ncbi:hypothetical protein [Methylocella sp. CPCC 101449]|uniref:hypothetical protein n=1 Tax=Methylocella sp. CPCC 101449 TaxID=2987531 RepID=UPI002891C5F1|nr:hypothetical protein [Methylocella sp. CPCC 101449]MDT2022823.1 hypothetical protein [Methylocella sp. CPCC 101449]